MDGVANEDRVFEVPFADAQDRQGAHGGGDHAQAAADGPAQQAMGDGLAKCSRFGELAVHVNGVEVSRQAGKGDEVRLGHGSAQGLPLLAHLDVVEEQVHGGVVHDGFHSGRYRLRLSAGVGLSGQQRPWLPAFRVDAHVDDFRFGHFEDLLAALRFDADLHGD